MATTAASPAPLAFLLESSPLQPSPSPSPSPSSLPSTTMAATPSRASRFTSVKDMLLLSEDFEASSSSITKAPLPPSSTKLKRPNKSAILASKSTNSPSSFLSKNGRISGKSTKPASFATTTTTTNIKPLKPDTFDVFAIPSSPNPTPPSPGGALLETSPRETKNPSLEAYIPAKRLWTPVKENSAPEVIDLCTPDDVAKAASTGSSFVSLMSSYKHEDISSVAGIFPSRDNSEPLKKGRRIGLVNIPGRNQTLTPLKEGLPSKEESVSETATTKQKKQKVKKAKTITGLALAPYLPPSTEPTTLQPLPETSIAKPAEDPNPKKPRKKREPNPNKTPNPKKTSKKTSQPAHQPLLSPKSVQKRMDSQTFVFGTSSQLLRTAPPEEGWTLETTGRKLNTIQTHVKIHEKASWDLETVSGAEDEGIERGKVQTECMVKTTGWRISDLDITKGSRVKDKTGTGMWSMASRGLSGELHSVQVMDLVDEDDLDDILSQKMPASSQQSAVSKKQNAQTKESKALAKEKVKENVAPPLLEKLPTAHCTKLPTPASTDPKTNCSKAGSKPKNENTEASTTVKLSDRPNFEGFTMVQLQTQIKKYGFKPVKSRNTMIDILNRCWDSAEAMVANPPEPVEIKPKAPAKGKGKKKTVADEDVEAPVPKKRGRKPKAATAGEDEMEAPPPKRRKSAAKGQQIDTTTMFKHIAAAIKQQPTSPDPSNPSWWHRILMNETVALGEFAGWLVERGLRAAGVDDSVWEDCGVAEDSMEKKVDVVRMWCEARSVSFVEGRS